MNIVFRADSGHKIGVGHIMRCLTLAKELIRKNHNVIFISRNHGGNIIDYVSENKIKVYELNITSSLDKRLSHSHWLGSTQREDAESTLDIIKKHSFSSVDWVVVDHYSLDEEWQSIIEPITKNIMVIDDLADRKHQCDILLDQTINRKYQDYKNITPEKCNLLLGSKFALLRNEFSVPLEKINHTRRKSLELKKKSLLIMMGGTDHLDLTSKILSLLPSFSHFEKITVLLGWSAAHKDKVINQFSIYENINILIGCNNVASVMLDHDLCIGAAGSSSWERCALGLPSILLTFADNQKYIAKNLADVGASYSLKLDFSEEDLSEALSFVTNNYQRMVDKCYLVCDGYGTNRVAERLINA